MAHFHNNALVGASGQGGYLINQSLRFDGSAYLSRSLGTTSSSWTVSFWTKTALNDSNDGYWFNTSQAAIYMDSSSGAASDRRYKFRDATSGSLIVSNAVIRDPSAWYHVVYKCDGSNRRLYVNNSLDAGFTYSGSTTLSGSSAIGAYYTGSGSQLEGYIAEFHFVDGTALDPSSFAEPDTITGAWIPKKYTGSYGSQGFYLKFDPSATNGIGHDHSGNGNNFTATGFSTSGTGTDVMSDTPTNNWCTWNPINSNATSITNGNLDFVGDTGTSYARGVIGTTAVRSGKWYFESTCTTAGTSFVGVIPDTFAGTSITDLEYVDGAYSYRNDGNKAQGTGDIFSAYGNSWTANDVIGVALDLDNGAVYFSKNGTWQNSGDPTSGSSKTGAAFTSFSGGYAPMACGFSSGAQSTNFGQRAFAYTPPTGFKALNTANLPEPTIKKGSKYFNTKTYTGNGSTQTLTGLGFSPDLVWIKARNPGYNHYLVDQVRGFNGSNARVLQPNLANSEESGAGIGEAFTAFTSDGFSVAEVGGWYGTNQNTTTYVAWCWDANGAGSSNTAGSITSTVSANPTAGFSIVTYTSQVSTKPITLGHGLGVKPSMIICKNRDASSAWTVYHSALGATKAVFLNSTLNSVTSVDYWNNTEPTSTVFTVYDSSGTHAYGTSNKMVAYCFSEVAGYSKFGSYTGNNSSDGSFIYTGFAVSFVMIKALESANWVIFDTSRSPYNLADDQLSPNTGGDEVTNDGTVDLLSNGFKLRNGAATTNAYTYVYAAFASTPFKYSTAR